ncbi:ATP phosphoribosyltransferase regulatory subunit [Paenibacillus senegalensis]|uniref:ATP phosphoribosyltransferase regulatory subunit n=1 Tax=Paenibacillus senegalensis TaxID=1465766 RepID=UPI000288753A|nr:ATP phosphoribosyltransferase regulatory subunit [Paenibacillus senegalensis]
MSKPKVFEKPTGLKDYLPEVVSRLRKIEANVLGCMEQWGYNQIITPTLEFYDTVGAASSTSDRKLFKLLDQQGRTLVLRSELTAPIARVASSLLKEKPFPLRLSYHSNVFRAFEQEAGRESEFFQTGVELVGDGSSEADAEVIALAIASLQAAGISSFKIALGHVGYLNGLLNHALGDREEEQQILKECLLRRDHVGYRQQLRRLQLNEETRAGLESILRLRGGEEICEQARAVTNDPVAQQSVEHLCLIWDVLKDYGVSHHVLIDLTMIGDFSYYTGMTFEGYSADLAFPVCSGGRYDNLLAQFGRSAPATGFALKTDRILDVVAKQPYQEPYRILIGYRPGNRKEALQRAAELRALKQCSVETKAFESDKHVHPNEDGSCSYLGVHYNEWIYYG